MTEPPTFEERTDGLPPFIRQTDSRREFLFNSIDGNLAAGACVLNLGNLGMDYSPGLSSDSVRNGLEQRDMSMVGCDMQDPPPRSGPEQVQADLHELPFDDGQFDAAYMGALIEHTWTPVAALNEVGRVMKSGGLLVLDTPNVYRLSDVVRWALRGRNDVGDADHKILFTPSMLAKLLRETGFDPIEFTTDRKYVLKGFNIPRWMPFISRMGADILCAARKVG